MAKKQKQNNLAFYLFCPSCIVQMFASTLFGQLVLQSHKAETQPPVPKQRCDATVLLFFISQNNKLPFLGSVHMLACSCLPLGIVGVILLQPCRAAEGQIPLPNKTIQRSLLSQFSYLF